MLFLWKGLSMIFPLCAYLKYRRHIAHRKRVRRWTDITVLSQVALSFAFHLSEAPGVPIMVYRVLRICDMAMIHVQCIVASISAGANNKQQQQQQQSSHHSSNNVTCAACLYVHAKAMYGIVSENNHSLVRFVSYMTLSKPIVLRIRPQQRTRLIGYSLLSYLIYMFNTDETHVLFHVSLYKLYKHAILAVATL